MDQPTITTPLLRLDSSNVLFLSADWEWDQGFTNLRISFRSGKVPEDLWTTEFRDAVLSGHPVDLEIGTFGPSMEYRVKGRMVSYRTDLWGPTEYDFQSQAPPRFLAR